MSFLDHLNEEYTDIEFETNERGLIIFVHDGIEITNIGQSPCGRFQLSPSDIYEQYGIGAIDAMYILSVNVEVLLCG